MLKIKSLILKSLLAISIFLTTIQTKIGSARAQISYMPAPGPTIYPAQSTIDNILNFFTKHTALAVAIGIIALVGLIIIIKYIFGLIIKAVSKK